MSPAPAADQEGGASGPAEAGAVVGAGAAGSASESTARDIVCAYCATPMPAEAQLCPKCGKWRSRFRNALVFWSGFTGLVTLVGTGALFLYAFALATYTRHAGADLRFINVSSLNGMSVMNNSSVGIAILTATFTFPGGKKTWMNIDKAIGPGEIAQVDLGALFVKQTQGGQLEFFAPDHVDRIVSLSDLGEEGNADPSIAEARKNEILADLDHAIYDDYTVEAINEGGSDYLRYKADPSGFIPADCTIEVEYQVAQGDAFPAAPDCIGLVRIRLKEPAKPKAASAAAP